MAKNETMTPSESEWQIMEILWAEGTSMTSLEVIQKLQGTQDMTSKMVRVLMNRLCQKGIIGYTKDTKDARVYHYFVLKSREECLREKSQRFVESYFSGHETSAMAALLQSCSFTDAQIKELEMVLEKAKRENGR